MIDKLVKEYNGEGVPFSYTSLTVSCALAYAGNLSLKEACAVGAITALGDDLLHNLTSKQPKPIINTITQASILCLVSAGLHHVVKTNYKAAVIESIQWFYLKSLILKPLDNIQKAIISKFMVARGSSITANIVAKIINNSTDDVATNIAKLEQYIADGKNVVAQGEEILIKDADNKIFDKFVSGKWLNGAGDIWKLALQKLGKPASGTILGENLVIIGKSRPANSHAHHITAGGASNIDAVNTRSILQREGIDINEATNGVFLPSSSKYAIDNATSHANVHTNLYYRTVFERLDAVPAGKVRDELQKIATELLNGTFPY